MDPARYSCQALTNSNPNILETESTELSNLFKPMFKGLGVVESEILNILHREITGFEDIHNLPKSRNVCAGENALSDPRAERGLLVAPNKVQEPAPGISDGPMNDVSKGFVALRPDVFQHPYGDKHSECPDTFCSRPR